MKIIHLVALHIRNDIRVFQKECVSLQKKYGDVTLVVNDGLGDEINQGVKIIDAGKAFGNRILKAIKINLNVYKRIKSLDADIYHFHDAELMLLGYFLILNGKKVVYDMHEDYALQITVRHWMPKRLAKIASIVFKLVEGFFVKRYTALIVPQPSMQNRYLNLNKRSTLVGNYVKKERLPENIKPKKKVNKVLYVGTISLPRGIYNVLDSLDFFDFELTILGVFTPASLYDEVKLHRNWNKVDFVGFVNHEELKTYYEQDYIGLIPFNNVAQYGYVYSIKSFEYMSYGLPLIMPNFGEYNDFNEEFPCGVNINTENPEEIAKAIKRLFNQDVTEYSLTGINSVKKFFTWTSEEEKLFKLYNEVVD